MLTGQGKKKLATLVYVKKAFYVINQPSLTEKKKLEK